jgi:TatD DNase family protein
MLIDSHCHLDRLDLLGGSADVDAILSVARQRGVDKFLAIGVDLDSSRKLIALAAEHPDVYVSVGAHPLQDEAIAVPGVDQLVDLAASECVIAIGETGLDYYYSAETSHWQKQSFINHLQAAKQVGKPVVVHTRNARADTLELISTHGCRQRGGVLHCFTENWEMAEAALALNFYISFSGIITFGNAKALRDVVKKVPLERILVETDSPWLAPVPYRGKPNVPAYVVEVAQQVAAIKQLSLKEVAAATSDNFQRLFGLA